MDGELSPRLRLGGEREGLRLFRVGGSRRGGGRQGGRRRGGRIQHAAVGGRGAVAGLLGRQVLPARLLALGRQGTCGTTEGGVKEPKPRGGRRLTAAGFLGGFGGNTHSPCRGFAAGPASPASSSFSCPGKYYEVVPWLSATPESPRRWGEGGVRSKRGRRCPQSGAGRGRGSRVRQRSIPRDTPNADTPHPPSTARSLPPAKFPRRGATGRGGGGGHPLPGGPCGHGAVGGHTYVVVPRRPGRVELGVQLPLLPRELVVLRLLLPRQRVPLRGGETTLRTPEPSRKPRSHAANLPKAIPQTPKPFHKL